MCIPIYTGLNVVYFSRVLFLIPGNLFNLPSEQVKRPMQAYRIMNYSIIRCLETIDVCIWHMFVFMSVVVTVWGSVGMFVV